MSQAVKPFERTRVTVPNGAVEALLRRQVQGRAELLASCKAQRPVFPPPSLLEADSVVSTASDVSAADSGKVVYLKTTAGEDLNAYEDHEDVLQAKALEIMRLLRSARRTVVFTGAGISTSANLPDYRSKNGLWRVNERGTTEAKQYTSLGAAQPTFAHLALVALHKKGLIDSIVTTNIDGLHRRASREQGEGAEMEVIELHGNAFEEVCTVCGHVYYRDEPVVHNLEALEQNTEPRVCGLNGCTGTLRDSVVRFGQTVPAEARAFKKASTSDLALIVGTSMRVSPACNMPRTVFTQNSGKMVLINRQNTAFEDEMWLHCYGNIDRVFEIILNAI